MTAKISRLISLGSVLIFLTFWMISCSGSVDIIYSESVSEVNKESLLESKNLLETKTYPESKDLLGSSSASFSVFVTSAVPRQVAELLHREVSNRIVNTGLYQLSLDNEELDSRLNTNKRLLQSKDIYLDSLSIVSVSDKDISNPLGKHLNVENLLVFQLDRWPCKDCEEKKGMRMKLRVVDAESGYIIWTGIIEAINFNAQEYENLGKVALNLAAELTDSFFDYFKKKWHRQRFDNLAKG